MFADTQGQAFAGTPDRIPYARQVQVSCKVRNTTSISSVTYWYRLESAPWKGAYAPSDTFANGDPLGAPGTHNVDAAVPDCH